MNNNLPMSLSNDGLLTKDTNDIPQLLDQNITPIKSRRGRPPKTPVTPKPVRSVGRPRKTTEQNCKSTVFY